MAAVISVVMGVAASTCILNCFSQRIFASYNIFSQDGGETWLGQKLGTNPKTFRGEWGDVSEDNRSQATVPMMEARCSSHGWIPTLKVR